MAETDNLKGKVRLTLDLTYKQLYRVLDALAIKKTEEGLNCEREPGPPPVEGPARTPDAQDAPAEGPLPADLPPSGGVTLSELRELAVELSRKRGPEAVRTVFLQFGAKNITAITPDCYAALKEALLEPLNF
jgi:hypothetical protein